MTVSVCTLGCTSIRSQSTFKSRYIRLLKGCYYIKAILEILPKKQVLILLDTKL